MKPDTDASARMYLGIDLGTSSVKAVLVDDAGEVRASATSPLEVSHHRARWSEQDPGLWEAALGPAIAEALTSAGTKAAAVGAIGFCGQLDGCIAVDADGKALSPCLTWMDRRATAEIADIPPESIRQIGGLRGFISPSPSWSSG